MSDLAVLQGKTQSNISTPNALNSSHTSLAKTQPMKHNTPANDQVDRVTDAHQVSFGAKTLKKMAQK